MKAGKEDIEQQIMVSHDIYQLIKNHQLAKSPSPLTLFPPTYFDLVITRRGTMVILPPTFLWMGDCY